MRTVKEISVLTGISVRTLHYYDEIGLLNPTDKSEAGYRVYDDKALETLQQILFFREFDIPLKEIRSVMCNPSLDRNKILQMQRILPGQAKTTARLSCMVRCGNIPWQLLLLVLKQMINRKSKKRTKSIKFVLLTLLNPSKPLLLLPSTFL